MEISFQLQDIQPVAETLWLQFPLQKVFAFHGGMGVGKTTFIHALCDVKGVTDTVGSPTFSIINEYRYPGGRIYHIDLYRLKDEEEAIRAGVEDCLYSGDICLVEWPARAEAILPENAARVEISVVDKETRTIHITEF